MENVEANCWNPVGIKEKQVTWQLTERHLSWFLIADVPETAVHLNSSWRKCTKKSRTMTKTQEARLKNGASLTTRPWIPTKTTCQSSVLLYCASLLYTKHRPFRGNWFCNRRSLVYMSDELSMWMKRFMLWSQFSRSKSYRTLISNYDNVMPACQNSAKS